MARRTRRPRSDVLLPDAIIDRDSADDASLLDVIDTVLNKGAVVDGDLILGVAKVDLIYARLSVLLAAFDRVMRDEGARTRRAKRSVRKKDGSARRRKRR